MPEPTFFPHIGSSPTPLSRRLSACSNSSLPPIITVTPASLTMENLTPPLTPSSGTGTGTGTPTCSPRPILKNRTSSSPIRVDGHFTPPITPSQGIFCFPVPQTLNSPPNPESGANSLQRPLQAHLALLHPSTPLEIVRFCAVRLLSPDRPYGHQGPWTPLHDVDLSAAGLALDAAKGCERSGGCKGAEVDRHLEEMYHAARESWRKLEERCPGVPGAAKV